MAQLMHTYGCIKEIPHRAMWILLGKPLWDTTSPHSPTPLLAVSASIVVGRRSRDYAALAVSRRLTWLGTV